MQKLIIKGRKELSGRISISGSKNATLPILAASILASHARIKNIPLVKDIFTMIELLNFIGLKVKLFKKENIIEISNTNKNINTLAPYKLVKTMRAGVLVLGSLLTKYRKAKVSLPGGCAIGTRPVNLHLFALKKLGAKIKIKDGDTILDLGCGRGRHIHKLYYYKKCHVIGLDLSLEDIKITYQGFETYPDITNDLNRHFNLMTGNALSLPFKDETFDQIICSEVLEHIPNYEKVIHEIHRVAKKNSYIGISVPNRIPEKICWYLSDEYHNEPGGHIHIFEKKQLINSFRNNNFFYLSKKLFFCFE